MNTEDGSTQEPTQFSAEGNGEGLGSSLSLPAEKSDANDFYLKASQPPQISATATQATPQIPEQESLTASEDRSPQKNAPAQDGSSSGVASLESSQDRTIVSAAPIADAQEFYPAGSVASLAQVLVGQTLDHYQLYELVGGGGMGAVFKASDLRLDRIVAVKVIPNLGRDQESLKRFRVEAQSAAKLDHPNIARVYYVGETAAWSYIVFEFVEGVNLRDLVIRNAPLSIDDAIFYTIQIAHALQHASDRAVVHRDIKPSNALVTSSGVVKVVDMGLARTTSLDQSTNDLTASGVTLGTFDYISPEQARDPRSADVRSDLYSLGCTLYYLLVGRPPYHQGTAIQKLLMHGETPPEDPRHFRDDVPAELVTIVRTLMAKRPRDRYQTPLELILDLQSLASELDLPKSQAGFVIPVNTSLTYFNWFHESFPWLVGFGCLFAATAYLYQQYLESSSFGISQDIITVPTSSSLVPSSVSLAPSVRPDTALRSGEFMERNRSFAEPIDATSPGKQQISSAVVLQNDTDALKSNAGVDSASKVAGNDIQGKKVSDLLSPIRPVDEPLSATETARKKIDMPLSTNSERNPGATVGETPIPSLDKIEIPFDLQSRTLADSAASIARDMKKTIVGTDVAGGAILSEEQNSNLANSLPMSKRDLDNVVTGTSSSRKSPILLVKSKRGPLADLNPNSIEATSTLSTLKEAIRTANEDLSVEEIWIDEDVIVVNETMLISRSNLIIRSVPGRRVRIEWKPDIFLARETTVEPFREVDEIDGSGPANLSYESPTYGATAYGSTDRGVWKCLFALENAKLSLNEVDVDVTLNGSSRSRAAAVAVGPGSQFEMKKGVVTLLSLNRTGVLAGVVIAGAASNVPPQVDLEDVIVRGLGDLIRMEIGMRSELRWRNGLLAVDGRLLNSGGAAIATKTPQNIRMDLQDVTIAASLGLARVRLTSNEPYPLCISRDAKNCTFVSEQDSSHITIEGVSLKESNELQQLLPTWVDLRGADNAYDEKIEVLLRLQGVGGDTRKFGFEAASLDFFSERAPETSIQWSQALDKSKSYDRRTPADYLQQSSGAFRSGMKMESLPNL